MSEQKLNAIKLTNVSPMPKRKKHLCFQGSVEFRRVDRTVRNQNTMPLPVTLDPLECKNVIRHLNGTNSFSYFQIVIVSIAPILIWALQFTCVGATFWLMSNALPSVYCRRHYCKSHRHVHVT